VIGALRERLDRIDAPSKAADGGGKQKKKDKGKGKGKEKK